MSRQKLIVGNWKMYPTLSDALVLAASLKDGLHQISGVEVVLAPPTSWLVSVIEHWRLKASHIHFAAQNVWPEDQGAYTGETSAYLVKSIVEYALVGHSERRQYGHEDNDLVKEKVHACLRWKITPILCVGEPKKIFDTNNNLNQHQLETLLDQLTEGLAGLSRDQVERVVIAYEPVWAIGTKNPATPEYAAKVAEKIRQKLTEHYSVTTAETIPILYGGSVDSNNAVDFLRQGLDGLLIGGLSVKAKDFVRVCQLASALR